MPRRHSLRPLMAGAIISFLTASAFAQSDVAPAKPTEVLPAVNPANELKGAALVDALRQGGNVLYMRHGETGEVTPTCEKSNLTPAGEAQAKAVGKAIRDLKIPIGKIYSSDICRVLQTAELVDLGPVETLEDLRATPKTPGFNVFEARDKRVHSLPAKGSNTLLVSHVHGGPSKNYWYNLELLEIIVFRADAKGEAQPVARIRAEQWPALAQAAQMPVR